MIADNIAMQTTNLGTLEFLTLVCKPAIHCGLRKDFPSVADFGFDQAKNQRPPAEIAAAPSRGHPYTPSSAGGR